MKFSYLSKEQIGRLDVGIEIPPEPKLIAMFEPNIDNALNLVTGEECSDAEFELSYETFVKLSPCGKGYFVWRFVKHGDKLSCFLERYRKVIRQFMPRYVEALDINGHTRETTRARHEPYIGAPAEPGFSYCALRNLLASDGKIVKMGSSFYLPIFSLMEHGAIDACMDTPVNGHVHVICFPDEIKKLR